MRRGLSVVLALAAVLFLAALFLRGDPAPDAGGETATPPPGTRPPNVILVLVDTLRADHLGLYGYERDTSPFLDEWASGAVVFEQAYAPSSWTRPSTVSLLSGLDPISHGVEDRLDVIPPHVRLLSERLEASGYATFGAITNPQVTSEWAFDRGFEVYDDLEAIGLGTRADAVADYVIERLDLLAERQPFFLYLHLIDPHWPYDAPPPWDARFAGHPGEYEEDYVGRYDGEVGFVDAQLARMLTALRERGLEDGSLTMLVSDHGEELLERGFLGHGGTLFEEVVRVPWIARLPAGAHGGRRVEERVSLIDVVPTTLALLGKPPAADLDGRDLTPLLAERPAAWTPRELFLSLRTTGPKSHLMRGLLSGPSKYLRRSRPTESEALYDLERDPMERDDLAPTRTEARARMAATLDAYLGGRSSGIHLRLVKALDGDPVGCEALLETTGRFVDVSAVRLEDEDALELADEGRELRLRCRLENRIQPTMTLGPRLLPDEDGLRFRVEPPDAPIVVRHLGLEDGSSLPLRAGSRPAADAYPLTLVATAEEWSVRDIGEGMSAAGPVQDGETARAYLGVIPAPESRASMSDELRERLEALGYVTETEASAGE